MNYTIFSDIHGNFRFLNRMIKILTKQYSVQKVLCLGDSLGNPPNLILFADIIFSQLKATSMKGNSDRKLLELLAETFPLKGPEENAFSLFSQTEERVHIIGESIAMTHGSVFSDIQYIRSIDDAKETIDWMISNDIHFLFHGHTHVPGVIVYDPEENRNTQHIKDLYRRKYKLNKGRYYVINPGSVGRAKDNSKEGFAIFDSDDLELTFVKI